MTGADERERARLTAVLGGPEATMTMSRSHAEIDRLVRRLGTHLAGGTPQPDQLDDLRATLHGSMPC